MKNKTYSKTVILAVCIILTFVLALEKGTLVSAADTIVPTYLAANGSTENAVTYQFQKEASAEALSIPIRISNVGTVGLEVTVNTSEEQPLNVTLSEVTNYKDLRDFLDFSRAESGQTVNLSSYAKGSGTWYLHVFRSKLDSNPDISVTVKAYQKGLPSGVTAGSGSLKNKKWSSFCLGDKETGYYKIKIPSSGCVKFEIDCGGEYSPETVLLNNKKKKVGGGESLEKEIYYGLKKGTYYIKMNNPNIDEQIYRLRYTFEKMNISKNIKKSKTIILKKGKSEKGMFLTGKSYSHYYKLNLTKDQTVTFNLLLKGGDGVLTLTNWENVYKGISSKNRKIKKKIKLRKGTYEITIDSTSGISYSLQWK